MGRTVVLLAATGERVCTLKTMMPVELSSSSCSVLHTIIQTVTLIMLIRDVAMRCYFMSGPDICSMELFPTEAARMLWLSMLPDVSDEI